MTYRLPLLLSYLLITSILTASYAAPQRIGIVDKGTPYLICKDSTYSGCFGQVAQLLQVAVPEAPCYVTGSEDQLITLLKQGEVDYVVGVNLQTNDLQVLSTVSFLQEKENDKEVRYGVVTTLDNVQLFYTLNNTLAQLNNSGEMDTLTSQWIQNKVIEPHAQMESVLHAFRIGLIVAVFALSILIIYLLVYYRLEKRKRRYVVKLMDNLPQPLAVMHKENGKLKYLFTNRLHHDDEIVKKSATTLSDAQEYVDNLSLSYDMTLEMQQPVSLEDKRSTDHHYMLYLSPCVYNEQHVVAKTIYNMREEMDLVRQAQESEQQIDQFIESISHEVRTPLNSILGFSQMLPELPVEDRGELMNIIDEKSILLNKLISELLLLSHIEGGFLSTQYTDINLEELLHEILERELLSAPHAPHEVLVQLDKPACPFVFKSDAMLLKEMLGSALNNALKFTSSGTITLGYFQHDSYLFVYIKDMGSGIHLSNVKKIFEPFMKVDTFTQGTGLGMSLMKQIAIILEAQIGVYSKYKHGTTIFFRWPIDTQTCTTNCSPTNSLLIDETDKALWID